MSLRLSLIVAGSISILAPVVHAQAPAIPPIVQELPMPPLVVPIVPAPLDENDQAILEASKLRTFQVPLKYVKPSVMAFWLDPKNQVMPGATGTALPPSPLKNFILPAGILRIVVVDPQNALLIFGTGKAVAELQTIIRFLDRPQTNLSFTVPTVTFEASFYWIDAFAPTAAEWQEAAPIPRMALPGELQALSDLKNQDRASFQSFALSSAAANQGINLPFPTTEVIKAPTIKPSLPNMSNGQEFHSLMPRINPDSDIDPGIQSHHFEPVTVVAQSEIMLTPTEIINDSLHLLVGDFGNFGFPATTLSLRDGDTFFLSGRTKANQLLSPSPRFDTFVLSVKVHIVQPNSPPLAPEPAK